MEAILGLFSPAFLSFFQGASDHTAFANQIRSGIEVVITGLIRNQFEGNLTWVRIPPAPPNASFMRFTPLGSWRFFTYWIAVSAPFRPFTIASAEDNLEL